MKLPVCFSWIFGTGLLLFCQFRVLAQPKTDTLVLCRPIADTVDLRPFGQFWMDSSQRISFPEIEEKRHTTHWFSFSETVPGSRLINGRYPMWLHFSVKNDEKDSLFIIFGLVAQAMDSLQIWQSTAGQTAFFLRGLTWNPDPNNPRELVSGRPGRICLAIPPGKITDLWIRCRYQYGFNPHQFPCFFDALAEAGTTRSKMTATLVLNMMLACCLLVSMVFALIRLLQTSGERVYLFYAATTFLALLYQWITVERSEPLLRFLPPPLVHNYAFWPPIVIGNYVCYLFFIQEFLRTRAENPRFHRRLNWLKNLLICWIVFTMLLFLMVDSYEIYRLNYWLRVFFYVFGLLVLSQLLWSMSRLGIYILTGTLCALAGGLTGMLLSYGQLSFVGPFEMEEVGSKTGLLLALVSLWIGLGERENEISRERAATREKLISQLEENARLREKVKQNLEVRLAFLSQQFKPHFLFNTLNSIRNFIGKGSTDEAEDYLVDFAAFLRQTLDASEKDRISLTDELALSENYLKMEQLRFRDRFEFEIKTGGHDLRFLELPPLLLQPFLENALKHGLLPKPGKGLLLIEIFNKNGELTLAIDDNGIGRAANRREKEGAEKTSHGLRISRQRIESFNELFDQNLWLELIDKFGADGRAAGMRVELTFR